MRGTFGVQSCGRLGSRCRFRASGTCCRRLGRLERSDASRGTSVEGPRDGHVLPWQCWGGLGRAKSIQGTGNGHPCRERWGFRICRLVGPMVLLRGLICCDLMERDLSSCGCLGWLWGVKLRVRHHVELLVLRAKRVDVAKAVSEGHKPRLL